MRDHATPELLSGYLDGELRPRDRQRVEGHLGDCRRCRERLEELRKVVIRLRALERRQPPPDLGVRVERQIARRPRRPGLLERLESFLEGFSIQPSLVPAFALVIALAAILYLFAYGLEEQARRGLEIVLQAEPKVEATGEASLDADASRRDRSEDLGSGAAEDRTPAPPPEALALAPAPEAEKEAEIPPAADAKEPLRGGKAEVGERRRQVREPEALSEEGREADEALSQVAALQRAVDRASKAAAAERLVVAGRTFLRREGVWWQQGIFGEAPSLEIDLGTAAGKKWLADHPGLAELAELGERVVLRWEGEILELLPASP